MKNKFLGSLLIALAFMTNAMPAGQPVANNTALHEMANKSNTQGIRDLVASGASVNATNANGDTPLHIAAESGRVNNVKALLEAGADFNIIGRFEHTPLHWAAINGHFECVQELVKAGSDITLQNRQNYTPAMLAALHGHQDIVVYFASLESLTSSSSASSSSSPLVVASQENTWTRTFEYCSELLPRQLEGELFLNKKDVNVYSQGETTLSSCFNHFFIYRESPALLEKLHKCLNLLIDAGAFVNLKNSDGQTALHKAAQLNLVESIMILLTAGASVDAQDNKGRTPLHVASWQGSIDAIAILVQKGASINTLDNEGQKPIALAHSFPCKAFLQQITDTGNEAFNTVVKDAENDTCPICFEGYLAGSNCITLSCGHDFCESCISESRGNGYDNCPVCRRDIIEDKIKRRTVTIRPTVEASSSSNSSSSASSSSLSDQKRKRDDQDDEQERKKRREEKQEVTSNSEDNSEDKSEAAEESSNCVIS